jgi:zinc transport system substrate-binding protein
MRPLLGLVAALALFAGGPALTGPAQAKSLKVVVSIKPIYSLVASVMSGYGAPILLIPSGESLYDYEPSPIDRRRLAEADVVFWIGPALETSLRRPLAEYAANAAVVGLAEVAGLVRFKTRDGGGWEPMIRASAEAGKAAEDALGLGWLRAGTEDQAIGAEVELAETEPAEAIDGHVWLDPLNAQLMVERIVEVLSDADLEDAVEYRRNGDALKERLRLLDADLEAELAAARGKPFLVLDDAYQYFEVRYALAALGSLSVPPDAMPDGKRLAAMRAKIEERRAVCVFGAPATVERVGAAVIDGTAAELGTLDPLGVGIPDGIDLYFVMMRRMAGAVTRCLAGEG